MQSYRIEGRNHTYFKVFRESRRLKTLNSEYSSDESVKFKRLNSSEREDSDFLSKWFQKKQLKVSSKVKMLKQPKAILPTLVDGQEALRKMRLENEYSVIREREKRTRELLRIQKVMERNREMYIDGKDIQ